MKKLTNDQKHFMEIVRAFHTDCVLHPGGWGEDLVPRWQQRVIRQRLELMDNGGWNQATDAEVAIYLSSASGIAPFNHDWTNIFVNEVAQIIGPQVYDAIDQEPRELSKYQREELNHLKHRIRNKQINTEKGEVMKKNKILIEERNDGTLIGISRDGVDPYVKKVNLTWEQILGQLPFLQGMTEIAEQQWTVSPKNPSYEAPAKAKKVEPPKKAEKKVEPPKEPKVEPEQAALMEDMKRVTPDSNTQAPTTNVTEAEAIEPVAPPKTKPSSNVSENEPSNVSASTEETSSKPLTRISADAFQYKLKDGRGPFADIQAAMDAMGLDKTTRPNHNRYNRLSKKLQEEIIQEKK